MSTAGLSLSLTDLGPRPQAATVEHNRSSGWLQPWWDAATDLLLGAGCAGCGTPGRGLCSACRLILDARRPDLTCPVPCPAGFPRTTSGGPYDDLLRHLVTAHKERRSLELTTPLAVQLAAAVLVLVDPHRQSRPPLCLVPVPSAARAVRERGFDAGWALARRAAGYLLEVHGLDAVACRVLVQRRGVQDQAGLDARARQENLRGRIRVARLPPRGRLLVVVDDVVTTGSSLAEAARALRAEGIGMLGAATVAAVVRTRPPAGSRSPAEN